MQPAAGKCLCGRLRFVPVAFDDIRPSDQQLADSRFETFFVELDVDDGGGELHRFRPETAVLVRQKRGDRCGLGETETISNPGAEMPRGSV